MALGGEGSGYGLKLAGGGGGVVRCPLMGGTWSLQRWHSEVIPLGAGSGGGIVCHYVHIVFQRIVITDTIPVARKIFDMSIHPYQLHSIAISSDLRKFFSINLTNLISFWDCPSDAFYTVSLSGQQCRLMTEVQ